MFVSEKYCFYFFQFLKINYFYLLILIQKIDTCYVLYDSLDEKSIGKRIEYLMNFLSNTRR